MNEWIACIACRFSFFFFFFFSFLDFLFSSWFFSSSSCFSLSFLGSKTKDFFDLLCYALLIGGSFGDPVPSFYTCGGVARCCLGMTLG